MAGIAHSGGRIMKTCDACKARKVKCTGAPGPCRDCTRRGTQCRFSRAKPPRRANTNSELSVAASPKLEAKTTTSTPDATRTTPTTTRDSDASCGNPNRGAKHPVQPSTWLPDLYIDRLLAQARTPENMKDRRPFAVKTNGLFVGNYSITFFSDARLAQMTRQLGNDKVKDLIRRISLIIGSRLQRPEMVSPGLLKANANGRETATLSAGEPLVYISLYFTHVHPLFPFLDKTAFESIAFSANLPNALAQNKAWSALYHAVLALGCQVHGSGSSWEPGTGKAWSLFTVSLALFPDLMTLPDSVPVLQAMAAITIYSLSISCIAIEHVIISEAARRAQNLGNVHLTGQTAANFQRTFWTLYTLEKISSFYFGRNSVFIDHDITTPVPATPDAVFGDFDWFVICTRHARLLSRAMIALFGVGVAGNEKTYYLSIIDQLSDELEQWRNFIPSSLRPGERFKVQAKHDPHLRSAALWTHFLYNSFRLSLGRATLHLAANSKAIVSTRRQSEATRLIMESSRAVLELTPAIDVEPQTPLWILAGFPVMALFVLFDLIINNPKHAETPSNLALLDISGGHFSRIEYATGGSLTGSLIAEFSYIAREYVNSLASYTSSFNPVRQLSDSSSQSGIPLQPEPSNTALMNSLEYLSHETTPMDTLFLPIDGDWSVDVEDMPTGTDIMGLFNFTIPGIDPIFLNHAPQEQVSSDSLADNSGLF